MWYCTNEHVTGFFLSTLSFCFFPCLCSPKADINAPNFLSSTCHSFTAMCFCAWCCTVQQSNARQNYLQKGKALIYFKDGFKISEVNCTGKNNLENWLRRRSSDKSFLWMWQGEQAQRWAPPCCWIHWKWLVLAVYSMPRSMDYKTWA